MKSPTIRTVTYLRAGRQKRASGDVIEHDGTMTKAMPHHPGWGAIWLSRQEIDAGKEKPAPKPRKSADTPPKAPRRPRTPKPQPPPAWRVLVDRVRIFETDHIPKGWPAVQMEFLTTLADELEAAHTRLAEFLPITPNTTTPCPTNQQPS